MNYMDFSNDELRLIKSAIMRTQSQIKSAAYEHSTNVNETFEEYDKYQELLLKLNKLENK